MHERERVQGAVQVDGATLGYVVEGKGRPCLIIGSATYYPRTFSRRLRNALRLAFADVRHFAESDGSLDPARISLDTYASDIERVRARIGFERGVVIGHSHHGNLALEYAKRHPSRVSHLVLIGSPPTGVSTVAERAASFWEEHATKGRKSLLRDNRAALRDVSAPQDAASAFVAQYVADGPKYWYDPTYDASFLWNGVPVDRDVIEVFRHFFSGEYELEWNPSQLSAPILVVMGRHDYAVPHILWDDVRATRRNLSYRLFEHSGHTPQLEEPERFDRILLDWIDGGTEYR